MKVLVLRPQPGADETAARARALGLETVVAPLFSVAPLAWTAPEGAFDAVMLTSASAARQAGGGMTPYLDLPCYAVGEATAAAAAEAGFADVRIGPDDGAALLMMMGEEGVERALHACGRDHLGLAYPGIAIARVPVYAAEAVAALPIEVEGALALLHSPRAAGLLARLVADRSTVRIAAISARTARAAGEGWASVAIAPRPRDEALLELAAKLCESGGG